MVKIIGTVTSHSGYGGNRQLIFPQYVTEERKHVYVQFHQLIQSFNDNQNTLSIILKSKLQNMWPCTEVVLVSVK